MFSSSVTQRDLAKALGVTQAAISLALRNHPSVSKARRKEVQLAAQTMGYVHNPTAVALNRYKLTSGAKPIRAALAWLNLWSEPSHLYSFKEFACYRKGAQECAEKFGFHLDEFDIKSTTPQQLEKILYARGIKGILLSPAETPPDFGEFDWSPFSAVRFGRGWPNAQTDLVTADQLGNALLAYDAIRLRGYKKMGWVHTKETNLLRGHLHEAGVLIAQWQSGSRDDVPMFRLDPKITPSSLLQLKRWIVKCKPDAIFSDYSRITELLRSTGYRVPEEIAVAGTTILDTDAQAGICQRPEEIGRAAALMLLSQMSDNACGVNPFPRQLLIPGTWVDGPSLPNRSASQPAL